MRKITDVSQKIKKNAGSSDFWFFIGIAAVILVMTVAVNYVFNHLGNSLMSVNTVPSWSYIYSNGKTPPVGNEDEWSTANSFTPMSKEKTGKYLHMRGSIDGAEKERRLIINADFAPMQISLDGEAVYNNHYGEDEYVGNRYNAVVLPATDGKTEIEISVYLPFSAEITAEITDDAKYPGLNISGAVIFTAIMLLLGIIEFFSALFLPMFRKKRSLGFAISGLTVLYALAVSLRAATGATYFINFRQFYNIAAAAEIIMILILTLAAKSASQVKDKKAVMLLLLGVIAAAATAFLPNTLPVRLGILAAALLSAFGTALCAADYARLLNKRIQYAGGFFIMLSFLSAINALCGIMQFSLSLGGSFTYCRIIGELIFLGFISFIFAAKAFGSESADVIELKTAVYDKCLKKTVEVMEGILSCRDKESVCRVTADSVPELCREILGESGGDNLTYTAALKENGVYRQIYSRLPEGGINYALIESRAADSGKHCLFSETYFDFVFTENGECSAVLHFENSENGLAPFFMSIMSAVYCCAEIALSRFSPYDDTEETKISVFKRLAANTELAAGNNPDHLEYVEYYTKILMRQMGYPEKLCDTVSAAAMLHDIGKTAIPPEITGKTGLLSESEREIIKRHTEYGRQLLSVFDGEFMRIAADIAAEHHERPDGKGYGGISGNSINEYAKIVTVADTVDALTTKRSYKEAWPIENVTEYIDSNAGTMFDKDAVAAMHACLDEIKAVVTEKNK